MSDVMFTGEESMTTDESLKHALMSDDAHKHNICVTRKFAQNTYIVYKPSENSEMVMRIRLNDMLDLFLDTYLNDGPTYGGKQ